MPEQCVGVPVAVAGDQLRIVEVVPGVQPHALAAARGAGATSCVGVQQRYLDAVDLSAWVLDQLEEGLGRRGDVADPQ